MGGGGVLEVQRQSERESVGRGCAQHGCAILPIGVYGAANGYLGRFVDVHFSRAQEPEEAHVAFVLGQPVGFHVGKARTE